MRTRLIHVVGCSVLLLLASASMASAQGEDGGIRLMTFNIRYGAADDGPNSWPQRRQLVADIIQEGTPDVLAIQEGLAFQLEELSGALNGYRKLGQHRDGGSEGEFSGLYVREGRVRVVGWGELWLSASPDSVGSVGWDAALARMAVWAEVLLAGEEEAVRVYGTHFDHRGTVARLESSRLLLSHAAEGPPAVFMGDFNAPEEAEPIALFFSQGFRSAVLAHRPDTETGTFNGFRDSTGGRRIDHILVDPDLRIEEAEILRASSTDPWPSDHFPVTARIGFR